MAHHLETGRSGELLAIDYLTNNGFMILQRNWKYSYYEIDIIAVTGNVLHFIEIKTRNGHQFGYPEESVSPKKIRNMMKAAAQYQLSYPGYRRIQYDVLSISLHGKEPAEYFFIEDVYAP
jgi:putative endonuclease